MQNNGRAGRTCSGNPERQNVEAKDGVGDIVVTLICLCAQKGWSFEECVSLAYNEIKDRKGKLIDGVFLKEKDL